MYCIQKQFGKQMPLIHVCLYDFCIADISAYMLDTEQ